MTPADLARKNAIAFECKKDGLRQTQAGTWKVTFTVLDMDERLTRAFPGTRYQAVLVEIDENEMPVSKPPAKEKSASSEKEPATPPAAPSKPLPEVKRDKMDWRELTAPTQAAIRSDDPIFHAFLREEYNRPDITSNESAAEFIRCFGGMKSRSELSTDHRKRVIWHQLDSQFLAWKALERT